MLSNIKLVSRRLPLVYLLNVSNMDYLW